MTGDFRKDYSQVWKALFDVAKEHVADMDHCFDCGKKLKEGEFVFQCDSKGFLIFCNDCLFEHADRRIFWSRVFNAHK